MIMYGIDASKVPENTGKITAFLDELEQKGFPQFKSEYSIGEDLTYFGENDSTGLGVALFLANVISCVEDIDVKFRRYEVDTVSQKTGDKIHINRCFVGLDMTGGCPPWELKEKTKAMSKNDWDNLLKGYTDKISDVSQRPEWYDYSTPIA